MIVKKQTISNVKIGLDLMFYQNSCFATAGIKRYVIEILLFPNLTDIPHLSRKYNRKSISFTKFIRQDRRSKGRTSTLQSSFVTETSFKLIIGKKILFI